MKGFCSLMDRMAGYGPADPGSNPGRSIWLTFSDVQPVFGCGILVKR